MGNQITEYALFYSKFKDADLQAVTEFVLIIAEKSAQQQAAAAAPGEENKKEEEKKIPSPAAAAGSAVKRGPAAPQKVLGIGFCVYPLYKEGNALLDAGVKSTELIQGSPRLVISGKLLSTLKRSQVVFKYEIVYGN